MDGRKDEQDVALLALIAIVAIVGLVGIFLSAGFKSTGSPSGMVISEQSDCDSCYGAPVCAAKGEKVLTYPSACDAVCNGARVIYEDSCDALSTR